MNHPDPHLSPMTDQAVSADINEAHVTGNIVSDPRFKMTVTGHEVATLIVQTVRTFRTDGKQKLKVEHHHVAAWDAIADKLRDVKPGDRVSVFGYLQTHSFADRETGVKIPKTEIVADSVIRHH